MALYPPLQVSTVASALPKAYVPRVVTLLAEQLSASPHLEFLLIWVRPHFELVGGPILLDGATLSYTWLTRSIPVS